jgi:CRP-like cAMP-binding protein
MSFSSFFDYPGEAGVREQPPREAVLLPDLDDAGWNTLIAYMEVHRFAPGEVVITAGSDDRALHVVADGVLELALPDGPTSLETGAVIGEVAFFDGQAHDTTIRAVTDVDLLSLSPDAFETLAAREPALARALLFDLGRILALSLRAARNDER